MQRLNHKYPVILSSLTSQPLLRPPSRGNIKFLPSTHYKLPTHTASLSRRL